MLIQACGILKASLRLLLNGAVTTGLLRGPFPFFGSWTELRYSSMRVTCSLRDRSFSQGRKLPRAEITLAHEEAVKAFGGFGTKVSGVPLLRVYWYDGTSTGPTAQHLTLAHLQDVKVRLGFVNSVGEQKGC